MVYIAVCWWSRWIVITQKKLIFIYIREHHSSSLLTTQSNVGTMLHSVLLHVLPFDGGGIPNSEKLQVLKGWGQHWNSLMRYTLKSNSLINLNNLAVGVFVYGVPLHFFLEVFVLTIWQIRMLHHIRGFLAVWPQSTLQPPLFSPDLFGNLVTVALHKIRESDVLFLTAAFNSRALSMWLNNRRIQPITTTNQELLV